MLNSAFISSQMHFVSDVGDKNFLIIPVALGYLFYLLYLGKRHEAFILLAGFLSPLVSYLLKLIFRSPRPAMANPNFSFDKLYGFPSSHTFGYTVLFGLLIYFSFKLNIIPLPIRVVTILISTYLISLIGISRVYLGQHYVWDVVGGYIFGLLYLIILIALDKGI